MVVAGLVDVHGEHVLDPAGEPAPGVARPAEVVAGEVEEVDEEPDEGGHSEGPAPVGEQRQGNVLDVPGPGECAEVLRVVAQRVQQLPHLLLGRRAVTRQGNLSVQGPLDDC